ncbi:MAG: PhnA domain-containing protein [Enterobacter hormaechei]|nr:PhnA domain-containing protein [Enterobacter hormaechei]
MQLPHCPKCNSEYTYEDNGMFVCPECAHEWNDAEPASMLKIGTKVKNIRLVEGDHNIDCKIDGFGPMKLKSEFVKKN